MGSKAKRGSQSSGTGRERVNSNTSGNSNLSPKTPAARPSSGSGSFHSDSSPEKTSQEKHSSNSVEKLAITKTRGIQLPGLPFKSFKNGTLITHNGEPTVRPAMDTLPAAWSTSRLSAASPSFVPSTPSPKPFVNIVNAQRHIGLPTPPTAGYEKVQNLLQDIRASPTYEYEGQDVGQNNGYSGGYNGGYHGAFQVQDSVQGHGSVTGHGGYIQQNHGQVQFAGVIGRYQTPPGPIGGMSRTHTPSPGPSSAHSYDAVPKGPRNPGTLAVQPPRQSSTLAQRPTREFLARKDRGKKDILVTAEGITRNHVRIIERQLPNGIPYQSLYYDYDAPKYDFVEAFKAMTAQEKEDCLGKNFIDIEVRIKTPEEEIQSATAKIDEPKGKKGKGKGKSKAKAAKETVVIPDETVKSTVMTKREVTPLDVLQSLGPDIVTYTKRLTVTLAFPPSNNPADLSPMSSAGPVAQLSITPPAGPAQTSSDFVFIKKLVDYIHTFTNLTHLSIILRIPASQRMPFTMAQLHHVLPFYDLGFTDWDIKYLPENLSVPAKVQGWAVGQLDRERNKIIAERLRKVEEAVFVRGSVMPGISNEHLDAAAAGFNSAGISSSARGSRSSRASR
ncbi:hypothetical protein BKA65DRAFT_76883 [Rhexocercosporidium sp. MPI-PUGE-AT-0058]|nr:hypothetical protein BKA65DRAFT_76883 [Rhexocercosporidium sp. MPI-PUGE-AT-0058]